MTELTLDGLYKKFQNLLEGEVILDVRTLEEFQSGHIPGSLHIPYDQVHHHVEELKKYQQIYIYCHAGVRAAKAAAVLAEFGLTQGGCLSRGGIGSWFSAGYPIQRP